MNKNGFSTLIFYFLLTITCAAQSVEIKGRIVEKENGRPLDYGTVEVRKMSTGTYANENGEFSINIPEKNLNDTMIFYALGFVKKEIVITKLNSNKNNVVELEQQVFELKGITIKPQKTKIIKFGIKNKKPWKYQIANIFGAQCGHYIENKDNSTGLVKSVSFYIANVGHTDAPFRIRIYGKNMSKNCPGEDLLRENLVVRNTKGEGWFTVDISKYDIMFPEDGMYIMMEWIYSTDQYYYTRIGTKVLEDGSKQKIEGKFYGPSLGNVEKQKDACMWSKGLGAEWVALNSYFRGYVNVMINADISVVK